MSKKTPTALKADIAALQTLITTNLADNTIGSITPEKLRQILTNTTTVLIDVCDSFEALP